MLILIVLSLILFIDQSQSNVGSWNNSLFNPNVIFSSGLDSYVNLPIVPEEVGSKEANIAPFPLSQSLHLLHMAEGIKESNFVIGLAAYKSFLRGFPRLVGSLRNSGYEGHIILGVHKELSVKEYNYLRSQSVTLYTVNIVPCDASVTDAIQALKAHSTIRGKCPLGLEYLKLEWARYELARQWMEHCSTCTGWGLIIDTRDIIFQRNPFNNLPSPLLSKINLYFIEEISPYTSPVSDPSRSFILWNPRNRGHVSPCYGEESIKGYGERPVLNSGTILGTRQGLRRFLDVLIGEFLSNKGKSNCHGVSDQWTMNWIYYHGRFGEYNRTTSIPWGFGPVLTAGKACITVDRKPGAMDIMKRDNYGRLINNHEGQIASAIHQYDRCGDWMEQYIQSLNLRIPD